MTSTFYPHESSRTKIQGLRGILGVLAGTDAEKARQDMLNNMNLGLQG